MTNFPSPLDARFVQTLQSLLSRVAHLEVKCAAIDGGFPLSVLPGVVDSDYSSGDPQVYVNGSAALTGPYQVAKGTTVTAGASVFVIPVPPLQTYLVLGAS